MKYTVKVLILFAVFIGAICFFGGNMDEAMFGTTKTEKMGDAELPTLSLLSDNVTVGCLYGYTTPIDMYSIRENLVAIGADRIVEVLIEENQTDVRKLQYEVRDIASRKQMAEGTVTAFDREGEQKKARIKVFEELESGKEYAVEVLLIDSESRRIYYYFRVKYYEDCGFAEKVEFIRNFSEWARQKNEEAVKPFMESTYKGEGTNYAKVNIKDSVYMACWGDLEPKLLTKPRLTIGEIYSNMAVGTLNYMVELTTASGVEQYYVEEKFRVKVTDASKKYLLNYERTMEAVFDEQLASLSQNQFKLGIMNETEMELLTNSDASMLVFMRNKELWQYNMAENKLSKVFSYRGSKEAKTGPSCDQYDIRILKLYENGDISFMVYGYMGRGEYEGRTGILLYRYYRSEERIEELLYLPVSATYQKLKEELGTFSYMNEFDVFYFTVYDTMYSYNLITKELTAISEGVAEEDILFFRDSSFVAWQEDYSKLNILHLETGNKQELAASEGEFVRVLGRINENIIVSYGRLDDIVVRQDGSVLYPAYRANIVDGSLKERKSYQKEDVYISGAEVTTSSICFHRVVKTDSGEYKEIEDDYILNSTEAIRRAATLDHRITEKMFIEYYIDLPSAYAMKEIPVSEEIPCTLISEDTTVRIAKLENEAEEYMVYSFGEIAAITEDCAEAVVLADGQNVVGTVIDENGRVVWERGVKYATFSLKERERVSLKESGFTSRQEAVRMLASYMGQVIDVSALSPEQDIKAFLEKETGKRIISMKGVTVEQMLHFVFRGAPVLGIRNETEAFVITGYTGSTVTVYNPAAGIYRTYSKEEAEKLFLEMGNWFFTYVQ